MLLLLSSGGFAGLPRRARMSVMIWFSWVVLGATGDVHTLGTIGGPIEKPRPVTLSSCVALRLLIASVVFVALRVEMPGTGGAVPMPPANLWSLPSTVNALPLKVELVGASFTR